MSSAMTAMKVRGDANEVDSFAACLCAVLEQFNLPADYSFVEALTGTCFAPCYNKGEDCVGWMVDGGSAARADWMAGALGLSIQVIRLGHAVTFQAAPGSEPREKCAPQGWDWIDAYKVNGALPHEVKAYLETVCHAVSAGDAVLAGTWPAWSVLTGWNNNLAALPFVTTAGFELEVKSIYPPAYSRVAFALRPGGHALTRRIAMREALRYGALIAAGRVAPRLADYDGETEFGSAMYALLASLANEPNLCPNCRKNGCFGRAVKRIQHGLGTSVEFLKSYREYIQSGSAGQALENLIEQYAHMHHAISPYAGVDYQAATANAPEFRAALARDFNELTVMQVRAAEHFDALVEEVLEYA